MDRFSIRSSSWKILSEENHPEENVSSILSYYWTRHDVDCARTGT